MTTKQAYRLLSALILPFLLLTTGCDRSSNGIVDPLPPEPGLFTIESRQVAVDATTMEGTFEASGAIDDQGTVREVLDSAEPLYRRSSIHGMKTLTSRKGSFTIEFYAGLSRVDATMLHIHGGFVILEGSGIYIGLQGSGEIDLEVAASASPTVITRVLEGAVQATR